MTAGVADAAQVADPAAVLGLLPTRPRLLALGEPTHGEDVLLDLRNDLFRHLVEHEGYRTVAIESDCRAGPGRGRLRHLGHRGRSTTSWSTASATGSGASAANRELVRWMRAYNDGRPAAERLRFAGFDGPLEITGAASPRQTLTALHGYLTAWVDADLLPCTAETLDRLLGADDRWTEPAAMRDPTRSVGRTPEADELRLLADDLVALLDAQTPRLIAASSREDWHRARLYARTADRAAALPLLDGRHLARPPGAAARHQGRDDGRQPARPRRTRPDAGVHAHNGHLQRDKSSMRMGGAPLEWWSAGAIVSAHLGDGLRLPRHRPRHDPPPRRGHAAAGHPRRDCCTRCPTTASSSTSTRWRPPSADVKPVARVSPWFGYAPLDPAHLPSIDGLVFVKDTGT